MMPPCLSIPPRGSAPCRRRAICPTRRATPPSAGSCCRSPRSRCRSTRDSPCGKTCVPAPSAAATSAARNSRRRSTSVEEKLNAAKKDLQNQITEARTYAHDKIHDLTGDFAGFRGLHEARSEGVQNRINALMELVYHMRGQFDQVLAEQRASTAATQRAAVATETAVRLLTDRHTASGKTERQKAEGEKAGVQKKKPASHSSDLQGSLLPLLLPLAF